MHTAGNLWESTKLLCINLFISERKSEQKPSRERERERERERIHTRVQLWQIELVGGPHTNTRGRILQHLEFLLQTSSEPSFLHCLVAYVSLCVCVCLSLFFLPLLHSNHPPLSISVNQLNLQTQARTFSKTKRNSQTAGDGVCSLQQRASLPCSCSTETWKSREKAHLLRPQFVLAPRRFQSPEPSTETSGDFS